MRNVAQRSFAVVVSSIAVLCCSVVARAQTVDPAYDPGANQIVNALAVQPDGKIVVGGNFTGLGGGTGATTRNRIGRLNVDGTVDASFNPGTNGPVLAVAVQADGKILAGGNFTSVGGGTGLTTARSRIARFNGDGTVDTGFSPGTGGTGTLNVWSLALQPDGKILVGGEFTTLGGVPRSAIGRLNADGSIDTAFNPGVTKTSGNPIVYTMAVQTDGKIVVGGYFNGLGGAVRNYIGRLNADAGGTVDAGFDPGANSIGGVNALALQADGKILVGGTFTRLGGGGGPALGVPRANIGRLLTDGTVDSFNPGAETQVLTLAVQGDGKILAGGYFKWLGNAGVTPGLSVRNYIGRINPDGIVDGSFDPGANNVVNAVALQANGAIVAGGIFDHLGNGASLAAGAGTLRNRIGRILNSAACTFALSSPSASVSSGVNAGSVTLTASNASCPWTASSNAFITVTSDSSGMGTTLVKWVTSINSSTSPRVGAITIAGLTFTITQAGASTTRRVDIDFNRDAISDIAVFRPSLGRWFVNGQPNNDWGAAGDMPVPGDYDGDGNPDITVFRPSNGTWYVKNGVTVVWGMPGDIPVPGDYNGDRVTDIAVFRPGTGQWYVRNVGTYAWGLAGDLPVHADYNGDGTTDIAVYRPSTGTWYVRNITTAVYGFAADIPVPGDYNGDGSADIAVFRPATGTWLVMGQYTEAWGAAGDVPVPMDRSGDGIAELGVFRPATGTWYFRNHVTDTSEIILWGAAGDIPLGRALPPVRTLAGDFDGDRKADLTVFRPSTGDWVTARSLSGFTDYTVHTFGISGDIPVARDYDGDGKIDPAVFRPSSSRWYMLRSSTGYTDYIVKDWGVSGDIPVPGDYDGDGKADVAVFRPSLGRWVILLSSSGNTTYLVYDFGANGDIPVPADYDGDGRTDIAVFRPSSGDWFIYNRIAGTYTASGWGVNGDVPAPADFDGDGKADLTVFRPSLGRWFIKSSIDGSSQAIDWGLSGDVMVPADFDADGKADVAVFRPSTGYWYVRGQFNRSWGLAGDLSGIKIP
ncbi:MAG: FG-GAP-like repeat-containing protein [Vicinamibacterales bacterium]